MKWFFVFIILFAPLAANSATYYVAPRGNDDHTGSLEKPWATWQKAIRTARAGDTVYFRGGVYYVTSTQSCVPPHYGHNGTRTAPICYFNYPGEVPILDGINCTTTKTGLLFQGVSNIHLKGLHVRNFLQYESDNTFGTCMAFSNGNNIIIEQCVAYNAGMRGFYLHGCDTAMVLNCDAFNCCDNLSAGYEGGGGDGFLVWDNGVAADSINHIVLRGCRSWHNSDDGYDIETEGYIGVESCWAWNNGYLKGDGVGFKFGFKDHSSTGLSRQLTNCLSAYNSYCGFDENSSDFQCMTANVFNCISYRNAQYGFSTCYDCLNMKINVYRNNIAYNDGKPMPKPTGLMKDSYNSWNTPPGVTLTDADFISVDSTGISGPRKADGTLPDISFMKPAVSSDLIDAGTNTGLPYFGLAPDLGYAETNYGAEVMVTGITVTGAGNASSIVTDNGTLQLNKTVIPSNATHQSVRWSIVNGAGLATLSSTGLVTALNNGAVTVKATANDGSGVYGTLTITISNQVIPVTGLTVTGAGGSSGISTDKGTLQLNATVLPSNATNKSVRWSVVNGTGQADISSTGLVTAIANGTVTAKATANDGSGVSSSYPVTISNQFIPVTGITVTCTGGVAPVISNLDTLQLHAYVMPENATDKTYTWSVINVTGLATINTAGMLIPVSAGVVAAKATANDGSGLTDTLEITIYENVVKVESIVVEPACDSLPIIRGIPGQLQMKAGFVPENVSKPDVDWNIENLSGTATVDKNGIVTGLSDGTVKVVAEATDGTGVTGYCMVTIFSQVVPANSHHMNSSAYYTYLTEKKLIIEFNNQPDIILCSVYNSMGIIMHQQSIGYFPAAIDVSSFSPGVYIIILTDGQQSFVMKSIVP